MHTMEVEEREIREKESSSIIHFICATLKIPMGKLKCGKRAMPGENITQDVKMNALLVEAAAMWDISSRHIERKIHRTNQRKKNQKEEEEEKALTHQRKTE